MYSRLRDQKQLLRGFEVLKAVMCEEQIFLGIVNFPLYCRHLHGQTQQRVASYETAVIPDHHTRCNIAEDLKSFKVSVIHVFWPGRDFVLDYQKRTSNLSCFLTPRIYRMNSVRILNDFASFL
jgi:hypothetical protein